jgi:hypothetical protein
MTFITCFILIIFLLVGRGYGSGELYKKRVVSLWLLTTGAPQSQQPKIIVWSEARIEYEGLLLPLQKL